VAAPAKPRRPAGSPRPAKSRPSTPHPAPARKDGRNGSSRRADDPTSALLRAAVEEAARLLEADGAMVYLVDEAGDGRLRFAHDAGIRSKRSRDWIRDVVLEPGTGMFGRAVAERAVVLTEDYVNDPSFPHAPGPDRVVEDIGIRSMVVAPLKHGDQVYGALGAFSKRTSAFDPAHVALVRSLADHAAAAMANTRLIAELDASRARLADQAEVERTLREINVRISAASDLSDVLQRAVDEAARLLHADGARIDLIEARTGLLRWAYASGALKPDDTVWPDDPDETLDQGVSGQAVTSGKPFWTGDYPNDARFPHGDGADSYIDVTGITSVMAAPLIGEAGPFGTLTIFTGRLDAWGEADADLLGSIAAQAAIAITRARLIDELDRSRARLGRRAEAEQALREIAARITALRDPAEILQEVVELASRLVGGQGAILDLLDPGTGDLRWAFDDGLSRLFSEEERAKLWISVGQGATGVAVAEDRVVIAGDDLESMFPPGPENTQFYERTGFHSMIAAPITGDDGPLGVIEVYSVERDAFDSSDADLVRALAGQAAIAITNARLIRELAESRAVLARTADAERTLREIAARVGAMRDEAEILQAVVDAATRLLRADGAMIDLLGDLGLTGAWTQQDDERIRQNVPLLEEIAVELGAGVSGLSLSTRQVEVTADYLTDDRFEHTPERDAFVRDRGIRSVMSAPLLQRGEVLGAITVYATRPDAFDPSDGAVLAGLADQAAVAIATVHLIDQLERSRVEVARRAEAERTLREIAARVSAILDPADVLERIVIEAARILGSDGARIDLWDEDIGALRWAYASGDAMRDVPDWGRTGGLRPRQAVAGLAFAELAPVMTPDYLTDERFETTPEIEAFVRTAGIRAVISAPLIGDAGPLGVLSVVSRTPSAYSDDDVETVAALATQASIAITNANLMDQLARSRTDIQRRAEAEQALREIGASLTAMRDPSDVLQRVADESVRLLRADGAVIDQFDPDNETLRWAYDSGISDAQREGVKLTNLRLGEGVSGKAVAEARVITVGDYMAAEFQHDELADSLAAGEGLRDLIVAPIIGDGGPLGAIEVFSRTPHAFDSLDAAFLGSLAEQAAIAITNARLIDELRRSQTALARRAETERSLRDITARIAALHDPEAVFRRVVEDAMRLLRTDGAHLTRMAEGGGYLVPVVLSGAEEFDREWLMDMQFPLGEGINGLAALHGTPISTFDYLTDPRIPHEDSDQLVAERFALRGMAATPLRAPGGEVIGTLAVSSAEPRMFEPDELDLLGGLADQAAIALTNSNLLERLRESEERYRYLVQNAPDVVWSIDAESKLTFLSDACERLTGFKPEELLGKHFGAIVHESSRDVAEIDWTLAMDAPSQELRGRISLLHRDGSAVPAEFIAVASLDAEGRFSGANGSVRDMRERDRLEHELRRSEERYRFLVDNSPDIVFAIDTDGRFSYVSESVRRALGREPGDLIGDTYGSIIHYDRPETEGMLFAAMRADPDLELMTRMELKHADGRLIPFEVSSVGVRVDGEFAGIHGAARDIDERERLERDLRDSESRYRFLVENSPDVLFATDPQGRFTFLSTAITAITGYTPEELLGQPITTVVDPSSLRQSDDLWQALVSEPGTPAQGAFKLRRKDGRQVPADIRGVGLFEDGVFVGTQGATRDMSDQVRLETELRRQAGELAAGEERAHLARELHDSVTQALFSMTMVTRSTELLLDRDPAAAREQLGQLRELQREALAEMRALIFELRPGNVEQDGLVRALKTHTSALQGRLGLPIVVESDLDERLPLAVEETLYRIAQEALHNVVKHAKATQVWVGIHATAGGVRLRVRDDGKGFDPTSVPDGHLGLAGMRARADRLAATFTCTSKPGEGTTIEVRLGSDDLDRLRGAGGDAATPVPLDASPSIRDD
jgi:PAS domain S-box-containing protein